MRIGIALPQFGPQSRRVDEIVPFAVEAERLGAASLWVADRLYAPADPVVGYAGGDDIPVEFRRVLDPFALLAAVATHTSTATLGSSVLNLPWYQPVALARLLTTIDVLSSGRLLPGFGIGWSPDEYRASGVPWEGRGARFDEALDLLDQAWTADVLAHEGEHYSVPAGYVDLKPARKPPVHLGGFSKVAFQRIARRGAGWLPVLQVGATAQDPAPLARAREQIGAGTPAVLRLNAARDTPIGAIADTALASAQAGFDDLFVDLSYVVDEPSEALDRFADLLAKTA
ncbi:MULTISPECIES: TIGR03619 family F420-dependent LLM class oxidoreductase [Actinosynnema]|uniref:TIGR03619 family F420-dependent LLM class oxidoreductase n=1 Tax=Actinosynnema TaxID=40566 RepID=UPI0020A5E25D|nr:TIGR03619 family F420-dependent LLM class oxidoreductase [Actinosynnema pretiosum]MCP2092629.1 putative F420-dependent oxidoreductase, Rv2161c family [Actinosynnema pretiosum]